MASADLPDLDALALELVQVKHRQRELVRHHERLSERLMSFPTDFAREKVEKAAQEVEAMNARIEKLEAQLLPIRRHPER